MADPLRQGRRGGVNVAYCTTPRPGGIFRHYRGLRQMLEPRGWNVQGVCVGPHGAFWDDAFADDRCVRVAGDGSDLKESARRFVGWLGENRIDVLVYTYNPVVHAAVPHFPEHVRLVTRGFDVTPHSYWVATVHQERASAVVATSQRQAEDLRARWNVPNEKLHLIPHGIDTAAFGGDRPTPAMCGPLRLAFIGRIEQAQKCVNLLPRIMDRLARSGTDCQLQVVGSGPDERGLRRRCERIQQPNRVQFLGAQPHARIASLLAETDILLLPSRHEGFGFSLVEAMAAGVVPVASRIQGVTDWIVRDGTDGVLCRIGCAEQFADVVASLARDRHRLAAMSESARQRAAHHFSLTAMGERYHRLFGDLMEQPPPVAAPRPWSAFRPPAPPPGHWRRWIPGPVRQWLRGTVERARLV